MFLLEILRKFHVKISKEFFFLPTAMVLREHLPDLGSEPLIFLRWIPRFYPILFWNEMESFLLFIYIRNVYKTVWFIYKLSSLIIIKTCTPKKVNIIPKYNSWLVEAANVRLKIHSENVVPCIAVYVWTQTWFFVGLHYVTYGFLLRRVAYCDLCVNGRKCCFVYCSV